MKKIWIFNHYTVPSYLNSQSRHNQFAKHLKAKGYDVSIFSASYLHQRKYNLIENNNDFEKKVINDINHIIVKTRNYKSGKERVLNMFDYYLGLKKYAENCKKKDIPDVIYASSVHPLALLAGLNIAKKNKIRCVCEVRDLWPFTLVEMGSLKRKSIITKLLYHIEKRIYMKSDKLIFTMSGGKEYIIDQGWDRKINLNKIHHINNGVNINDFEEDKKRFKYSNEEFNKENYKVTYTGSIGKANMVHTIINAAKIIEDETNTNIVFEIFGDGLERNKLQSYIEKENINNVNFYGRVERKYIPSILSKSKINVIVGKDSPLYKYGFSQNKVFTYLASKRPIISDQKTHKMLEKHGSGIVVKPEDSRSLAKGILEMYNLSEQEYKDLCDNAYNLVQEYDYKILTDKLEKVLFD